MSKSWKPVYRAITAGVVAGLPFISDWYAPVVSGAVVVAWLMLIE